jgi:hypothetical protein
MNANDIKCRRDYTTNRAAAFGGPEVVRVLRKVEVPNYNRAGSETWLVVRFAEDGAKMRMHPSAIDRAA